MKLALTLPQHQPLPVAISLQPDTEVDVRGFLQVFITRLPLILLAIVLCLGGAVYYLWRTPKIFVSNAVLEVKQATQGLLAKDSAANMINALEEQHTFEQSLTNRTLIIGMARSLKLDEDARLFPRHDGTLPVTDAELAKAFGSRVQAELRRGTRLVDLRTTFYDALTAKKMADKMIELFVEQSVSQESGASLKAGNSLAKEAARLQEKMAQSEKHLQEFKENNNSVAQGGDYNMSLDRVKELNAQFSKARGVRLQLESDMARLEQLATAEPTSLLRLSSIATLPEVVELIKEIDAEESRFIALKEWCSARHPRYVEAQKKLEFLKATRDSAAQSAAGRVRTSYENAVESENRLQAAIAEQEKSSVELGKQSVVFNQLQNEVNVDRQLYESVTTKLKETDVAARLAMTNFRVSEEPIVLPEAVWPHKTQILGLALAAGLVLGLGSAFSLEIFKQPARASSPADSARGRQLPVLAELPAVTGDGLALAIDCANRRSTTECEAFRTLRASLRFLRHDSEPRCIVVSAMAPEADAEYCATNLAATFAGEGLRTLVIGLDFNSGRLAEVLLGVQDNAVTGLSDGLVNGMAPGTFCHPTKIPNLYLIPPGEPTRDPMPLLASSGFRELMVLAWNSLDRIILCAPPVMEMPEPLVPLRFAEAVCLVAVSGRTTQAQITAAVEKLDFTGHAPAGLAMHGAELRALRWPSEHSGSGLKNITTSV